MRYFMLPAVLLFLAGCTSPKTGAVKKTSAEVKYARNFNLLQREGYVELQILQPENGQVEYAFALVKKNAAATVPAGLEKIEVPVKNMAVLSTTHIGMLDAIGSLSCIKGSTDANFVANPAIRKGIRSGAIANFNDETAISPERLLEKHITLVVYSGFGKEFPNREKLKRLGICAMPDYDWREEHPLGKAEWIKVFGYLAGKETEAAAYFANVESSYKKLQADVEVKKDAPRVLVGSLIGDVWYAPAGESYMATILENAGIDYIYANEKGTGSCERTFEQVFKDQRSAAIWLNPGAVSLAELADQQPKYALFRAFQSGEVYCYTHDSNYFWEMSAVNPHWILSDFAIIAHTKSPGKLHFYRKLDN